MNILNFEALQVSDMDDWKTIFRFIEPSLGGSSVDKEVVGWIPAEWVKEESRREKVLMAYVIAANMPAMNAQCNYLAHRG